MTGGMKDALTAPFLLLHLGEDGVMNYTEQTYDPFAEAISDLAMLQLNHRVVDFAGVARAEGRRVMTQRFGADFWQHSYHRFGDFGRLP